MGRGHSSTLGLEGYSLDRPPGARPGHQLPTHPLGWGNSKHWVPASRGGLWFHFLLCHGVGGGIRAQLASWGRHREAGRQLWPSCQSTTRALTLQPARMGAGP